MCPASELISPFLDDQLEAPEAERIRRHLPGCEECAQRLSSYKSLGTLMKGLPRKPLPAGFLQRLASRPREVSASPLRPLALAASVAAAALIAVSIFGRRDPTQPLLADLPAEEIVPDAGPRPDLPARPGAKASKSSFTNEAQARALKEESDRLGIQAIVSADDDTINYPSGGPMTWGERKEQQMAYLRQLQQVRRAMGLPPENPGTPIAGQTSSLLAKPAGARGTPVRSGQTGERAWSGSFSGGLEGRVTIETAEDWARVWARVSKEPAPDVDFSRKRVAGVFLGERPEGVRLALSSIEPSETAVVVRYRELPGPAAETGPSSPYLLRELGRGDLPVRFELDSR